MSLLLDAGALIAVERGDRRVALLLESARRQDRQVLSTAPVWAQVWRASPRQALLARLRLAVLGPLRPFDRAEADEVGRLLAQRGTADVVDAHLVVVARAVPDAVVLTGDRGDLLALEPDLRVVTV